jgi:hypothetical protein
VRRHQHQKNASDKYCPGCDTALDVGCFNKKGIGKKGQQLFSSYCKSCLKDRTKEWAGPSREQNRQYRKKWLSSSATARKSMTDEGRRRRKRDPDRAKQNDLKSHLKKYDLTMQSFNELNDLQEGVCAICKELPAEGKRLCIDHDHAVIDRVRVRGLLCNRCNVILGMAKDNIAILQTAVAYLQRPMLLSKAA